MTDHGTDNCNLRYCDLQPESLLAQMRLSVPHGRGGDIDRTTHLSSKLFLLKGRGGGGGGGNVLLNVSHFFRCALGHGKVHPLPQNLETKTSHENKQEVGHNVQRPPGLPNITFILSFL